MVFVDNDHSQIFENASHDLLNTDYVGLDSEFKTQHTKFSDSKTRMAIL